MPQKFEVSSATYKRLSMLATGFQSPEETIVWLLDFHDRIKGKRPKHSKGQENNPDVPELLDLDNPPDLVATRAEGYVLGNHFTNWGQLAHVIHLAALEKIKSMEKVIKISKSQCSACLLNYRGISYQKGQGGTCSGQTASQDVRLAKSNTGQVKAGRQRGHANCLGRSHGHF